MSARSAAMSLSDPDRMYETAYEGL
jgi:hypothetical protein